MHVTPGMMFARAEVRLSLGMYEAAIDDFSTAIPSADTVCRIDALHGRSEAWLALKDRKSAYEDLSTAIRTCLTTQDINIKKLSTLLYSRAKVAKLMNNFDSCLIDVSKALQLLPDFVDALKMRASLCYSLGVFLYIVINSSVTLV